MPKNYDLLVFGGGTVGGAIFLDAVSRGLKTALVEKSLIGRQTNRASMGLIQRDPKYLLHDIDLVFMNAADCGLLKTVAGDFLKKQIIIIPHFQDSKHPLWLLDSYIGILDRFASLSGSDKHQKLSRQELILREPLLRKDLAGGVLYDEWMVDPAELNAAFINGAKKLGGDVFESVKLLAFTNKTAGSLITMETILLRRETDGKYEELTADYFINATGPWSPSFLKILNLPPFTTRMTKGSSIVVNQKLSRSAIILFDEHNQYVAILPQKDGKTLIGPTNLDVPDKIAENPDLLSASKEEVDSLLKIASNFFRCRLGPENIVEIRCGLRPQLYGTNPYDATHEFMIIDHGLRDGVINLFSVFGGKLSNQLRMAKEAVDLVCDLNWKIPQLQIKENGVKIDPKANQPIEKLYTRKFALSFKDKVGAIVWNKKIKSLLFVAYCIAIDQLCTIWPTRLFKKGGNHAQ